MTSPLPLPCPRHGCFLAAQPFNGGGVRVNATRPSISARINSRIRQFIDCFIFPLYRQVWSNRSRSDSGNMTLMRTIGSSFGVPRFCFAMTKHYFMADALDKCTSKALNESIASIEICQGSFMARARFATEYLSIRLVGAHALEFQLPWPGDGRTMATSSGWRLATAVGSTPRNSVKGREV